MPAPNHIPPLARSLLRRDFLRFGALGLSLPQFLSLNATAKVAEKGFGRAKSCIVMFAWGGISHLDSWDPKPSAPSEIRGEFLPIHTSVPGVLVGEHMPLIAKQMHHMTVVRSVHHRAPSHRSAAYWNLTGHQPPKLDGDWNATRNDWPCIGSMVAAAKSNERVNEALPTAVSLPYPLADGGKANGQDGGFLGTAFDPAIFRPTSGDPYKGVSPTSGHIDLNFPPGLNDARAHARRSLLGEVGSVIGSPKDTASFEQSRQDALEMMLSPDVRKAFDLDREPRRVREAYGDHICGQSTLLARRLSEAGVPLTTVYCAAGDLNGSRGDHFDTHGYNFKRLRRDMLPPYDRASSALLEDLHQRGRLEDTLVCWLTEFGRTPRINGQAGRDHFPNCYSVAFAGAGIKEGHVYGRSNAIGYEPADAACGPADLHATIFHALGIDPHLEIHDQVGRPFQICDGKRLPLFA
ncbi:MAG: hypothetical protein CMO80_13150 [Verrucomicrobiales bacterium]|nr:hypothetical protein [Verrucomicrobiales bacterium]|tara:strand:- start:2640 stop:4031 length:1392 start_codon:yes stop_codon:yes gene_type:complete